TRVPSAQAGRPGAGSMSTAGAAAASSRSSPPSPKTWSAVTSRKSAPPGARERPLQPALTEDVVGGDQQEQRLAQDLSLDGGQRRAVAICPPLGIHHPDPVAPKATADRRPRP